MTIVKISFLPQISLQMFLNLTKFLIKWTGKLTLNNI